MAQSRYTRYYGGLIDHNRDANTLKVQVYYSIGGVNWATMREEERGYYFSITPVRIEDHGNYKVEETWMFSGIKALILPVKRQSQKRFEQAKAMTDDLMDKHCAAFLADNGLELPDGADYEEVTR
jgi:hypothetical protein